MWGLIVIVRRLGTVEHIKAAFAFTLEGKALVVVALQPADAVQHTANLLFILALAYFHLKHSRNQPVFTVCFTGAAALVAPITGMIGGVGDGIGFPSGKAAGEGVLLHKVGGGFENGAVFKLALPVADQPGIEASFDAGQPHPRRQAGNVGGQFQGGRHQRKTAGKATMAAVVLPSDESPYRWKPPPGSRSKPSKGAAKAVPSASSRRLIDCSLHKCPFMWLNTTGKKIAASAGKLNAQIS
ncbi:hypothetical protein HMPREF9371_0892 [Neisseria shayeganii 871]|uniref:Uncharacterized protein n=1 Tax=Neisseria shayeganii 871 TaxID=1032488 RepID=G4CH03_9NEIS|nr:hypothetical protein HMPREF9371_0892 [Neisseria shayeganii 871]